MEVVAHARHCVERAYSLRNWRFRWVGTGFGLPGVPLVFPIHLVIRSRYASDGSLAISTERRRLPGRTALADRGRTCGREASKYTRNASGGSVESRTVGALQKCPPRPFARS
jgi:hypothetical protein